MPYERFLTSRCTKVSVRRTPGIVATLVRRNSFRAAGDGSVTQPYMSWGPGADRNPGEFVHRRHRVRREVGLVRVHLHADERLERVAHHVRIRNCRHEDALFVDEAAQAAAHRTLAHTRAPGNACVGRSAVLPQCGDYLRV